LADEFGTEGPINVRLAVDAGLLYETAISTELPFSKVSAVHDRTQGFFPVHRTTTGVSDSDLGWDTPM
jgi:hypothetical protein